MALTITGVRPDPVLTPIAQEYGTGGGFAHEALMPSRSVEADNFKYMKWALRDFVQGMQYDSRRAPGDKSTRIEVPGGTFAEGTVHERSLVEELPWEILGNAPNPAIYENAIVRKLVNTLRTEVEREFWTLVNDTSAISNFTPTAKWDHATDGTIEADVDQAVEAFILQCGFEPTHIILPPAVAWVVKKDADIRDLRKYTDSTLLINGFLPPKMFNLSVVVPGAINDVENPGASASIQRVWTADKVVLAYVNPAAATDPTAMTAVTRFYSNASPGGQYAIERWEDPDRSKKVNNYLITSYDEILKTADCLYIINDVLT